MEHDQQGSSTTPDISSPGVPAPIAQSLPGPVPPVPVPPDQVPPGPPGAPFHGYGPPPGPPPQRWLGPGPYLPRRTWQQKTRTLITAMTGLSGVVWIACAIILMLLGAVVAQYQKTATFTGNGGVMVSCESSSTAGGAVEAGTPVIAWSDRSDRVLHTALRPVKRAEVIDPNDRAGGKAERCYLPFTLEQVRGDASGYNVRIGDTATQFVTTKSLKDGAIVPIVIGGDR